MNNRAKKYSKLIYFTDGVMKNLVHTMANTRKDNKKPDKHYPFNCVSKYYPLANGMPPEMRVDLTLPSGHLYGPSWGALKKCWKGYRYAKAYNDDLLMREYAHRIQKIETELGIPTASFPNLGMMGDLFFLYDKDKEMALRQKYMQENIRCDRFDVEGENFDVKKMVEEGKAIMFDSELEFRRYQEKKSYQAFHEVFDSWTKSEPFQEYIKASTRKWNHRQKIRDELKQIKAELESISEDKRRYKTNPNSSYSDREIVKKRNMRRKYLMQQKILKESEISSINATQVIKADNGYKYAKRIIKDDYRRSKLENEPRYYLTDLSGHRLADYKEENEMGYVNDPYIYRLYLEDKEWEKIYNNES